MRENAYRRKGFTCSDFENLIDSDKKINIYEFVELVFWLKDVATKNWENETNTERMRWLAGSVNAYTNVLELVDHVDCYE